MIIPVYLVWAPVLLLMFLASTYPTACLARRAVARDIETATRVETVLSV
jgi:hypothetical protein